MDSTTLAARVWRNRLEYYSKIYLDQECGNAGTTPLIPFGLTMLGPVIIGFGNDEQKDWVLKGILSGDGGAKDIPSQEQDQFS